MTRSDPASGGAVRTGQVAFEDSPDRCDAMGTRPLFTAYETSGAVRKSDPAPSAEAARRVDVKGQRAVILALFGRHPVLTADMLEDETGTHRSSWSSRLAGMRRDGLIENATPTVKTTAGRRQTVSSFRLTKAGRRVADLHRDGDGLDHRDGDGLGGVE